MLPLDHSDLAFCEVLTLALDLLLQPSDSPNPGEVEDEWATANGKIHAEFTFRAQPAKQ
ncbi:MAG: hypothetical protein ACE361_14485 [Aureliella sp.]